MGGWLSRISVNTGAIVWAVTAPELKCAICFWPYLPGVPKLNCSLVVVTYTTPHYFKEAFKEKLFFPHDLHFMNHKQVLF